MKKKKLIAFLMAGLIGLTLTGCEEEYDNTKAVVVETPKNLLDYRVEKPMFSKLFQPGEHVFYKRYYMPIRKGNNIYNNQASLVEQGSLEVPEGYSVLSINSVSLGVSSKYNEYDAIDVWFVNKELVSVEAVFNKDTNCYDYSDFGIVMIDLIDYGEIVPSK